MTSQSPRIYIYKITFEEVLYYYYGVHKEKYFNEEYWGTPVTNKWCWELYTPKKQILELFSYTDEGWIEAQEVEKRLIRPVFNIDKWCLNEVCGGVISFSTLSKGGKTGGTTNAKNKTGVCGRNKEKMLEDAKKGGKKVAELGIGIHALSPEQRKENSRKSGKMQYENKLGIHGRNREEMIEHGKKTASQRWECLETGFITNPGNLTHYQRARGIDTFKRRRIS